MADATPARADTPLSEVPLVFLDLETTGLSIAAGHRVCEVALVRVRGGVEEGRLSLLIDPESDFDPQAAAVNGLSAALLQGAPRFAEAADTILAAIGDGLIVAHNAQFDVAFLNHELSLLGRPPLTSPVLDTLSLARRLLRRASYSLKALATDLELPHPTHRALDDVLALWGVYNHLAELLAAQGIASLGDALRFERGLRPGEPEIEPPPLVSQAMSQQRRLQIIYSSRSSPEPTLRMIRPLGLTREHSGIFLRAFCFLRNDLRTFALAKITMMQIEE
jgi:DNA polymerase-3 subunit epsilon